MALTTNTLGVVAQNGQNSVYAYYTNDADTVVETASYFDDAAEGLRVGDWILASLDMDGTPESKIYWVSAISAANVVTITFPTIA